MNKIYIILFLLSVDNNGFANVCITFSPYFPFSLIHRNAKVHIFAVETITERGSSWFSIVCRNCSTNIKRSIFINNTIILKDETVNQKPISPNVDAWDNVGDEGGRCVSANNPDNERCLG